jgi:hypothetical protein
MSYERDWRDADACACLHDLGATAFAWEFLRRNCAYRAAYQAGAGDAAAEISEQVAHQWGLRFRGRSQPQRRSCACGVAAAQ